MMPLILQARSGRYSIQCRHSGCPWYTSGHHSKAAAQELADTHMLVWHGVKP